MLRQPSALALLFLAMTQLSYFAFHGNQQYLLSMKSGFVYMLTNRHHTTIYVGVTSHLYLRTKAHRDKLFPKSFSARYNLSKLVYYEVYDLMTDAIAREKALKGGSRKKKEDLINKFNPEWSDLFDTLFAEGNELF